MMEELRPSLRCDDDDDNNEAVAVGEEDDEVGEGGISDTDMGYDDKRWTLGRMGEEEEEEMVGDTGASTAPAVVVVVVVDDVIGTGATLMSVLPMSVVEADRGRRRRNVYLVSSIPCIAEVAAVANDDDDGEEDNNNDESDVCVCAELKANGKGPLLSSIEDDGCILC